MSRSSAYDYEYDQNNIEMFTTTTTTYQPDLSRNFETSHRS